MQFNTAKDEIEAGLEKAEKNRVFAKDKSFYKKYKNKQKFYQFIETNFKRNKNKFKFTKKEIEEYRSEFDELLNSYFHSIFEKNTESDLILNLNEVIPALRKVVVELKNTEFAKVDHLLKGLSLDIRFYEKYGVLKGDKKIINQFKKLKNTKNIKDELVKEVLEMSKNKKQNFVKVNLEDLDKYICD